jgi:hypothetical protein
MLASDFPQQPPELVYDRRQSPRFSLDAPALIDAFHTWRKCAVRSVSTSGISLLVDLKLEIGARADIYFEIPRAVAVEVHAEVVRQADGEIGFRFLDLCDEAAEAIADYVHSHTSQPPAEEAVYC